MKVQMLVKKGSAMPGEIVDLDPVDAARFIKSGAAKEVVQEVAAEADEEDAETIKSSKKPKK